MALQGILQGLGNEGASQERARQQALVEALSSAQEKRTEQEFGVKMRQSQAGIPQGEPYRGADGKVYQRTLDPNTGQVSAKEVGVPDAESKVQEVIRQLKQAEKEGIQLTPEEKQRVVEAVLGGKSTLSLGARPKQAWMQNPGKTFTSYMVDPYTNQEIPGTRNNNMVPPPGMLEHVRMGEFSWIDDENTLHRVPTTSTTRPVIPPTGGAGGAGGAGAAPPPRKPTQVRAGGAGATPLAATATPLPGRTGPRGSRTIGPVRDPIDRAIAGAAIREADKAKAMVDILYRTNQYMSGGNFTPRQDLAIIVSAVRAMNPGSVRLPQKELDLELKAGSYGDRFKRWYTTALTGLLPQDQREDLVRVIQGETTATASSAAGAWQQAMPTKPLPPYLKAFSNEAGSAQKELDEYEAKIKASAGIK